MKKYFLFLIVFLTVFLLLPLCQIPEVKAAPEWTTPDAIHSKCGEDGGAPAVRAIDDNLDNYWQHNTAGYHWIIFDMAETMTITKVRIYQRWATGSRFGKDAGYFIYVSDDPGDFGDAVGSGTVPVEVGWHESDAFEKDGRYIKLLSKDDATDQRIYEFDAYAEAADGLQEYTEEFSETTSVSTSRYGWKSIFYKQIEGITTTATSYDWRAKSFFYTETTTITEQVNKWVELRRFFTESIVVTETSSFAKELMMLVIEFVETIRVDASLFQWKEKLFSITESIGISTSMTALKEALLTFIEFSELIQFDADMILTFPIIPIPPEEPTTFGTLALVIAIVSLALVVTLIAKKR